MCSFVCLMCVAGFGVFVGKRSPFFDPNANITEGKYIIQLHVLDKSSEGLEDDSCNEHTGNAPLGRPQLARNGWEGSMAKIKENEAKTATLGSIGVQAIPF